MAIIKINEDYQIYIDNNKDHEARFDLHKTYINPKTSQEIEQFRSIGHYSNVLGACQSIYKDMNIKKADEKDSVTLLEWIKIINDNKIYMDELLKKVDDKY